MCESTTPSALVAAQKSESTRPVRAVLFDLDGTLADTAPDLAVALNALRHQAGLAALPVEAVRPWVSQGARGLIRGGFDLDANAPGAAELLVSLLDHYAAHVCVHTRLFSGMEQVLAQIEARGLRWGVVTNKPSRFAIPLMDGLGLGRRAGCLVCGDTLPVRKPDPAPVHLACERLGVPSAVSVLVGDDRRDIAAAHAAGAWSLAATYGYGTTLDPPHAWQAHGLVEEPGDLLRWLDRMT